MWMCLHCGITLKTKNWPYWQLAAHGAPPCPRSSEFANPHGVMVYCIPTGRKPNLRRFCTTPQSLFQHLATVGVPMGQLVDVAKGGQLLEYMKSILADTYEGLGIPINSVTMAVYHQHVGKLGGQLIWYGVNKVGDPPPHLVAVSEGYDPEHQDDEDDYDEWDEEDDEDDEDEDDYGYGDDFFRPEAGEDLNHRQD